MSYILDALQKAEQERRRGAVPGLQAPLAQAPTAARPAYGLYAMLALLLLVAGVLIGWWQPWRAPAQPQPVAQPLPAPVVEPAHSAIAQPSPAPVAVTPGVPAPPLAAPLPAPARPLPAPEPALVASSNPPASLPTSEDTPLLESLPASVRQGIPAMTVLVHSYSSQRKDRLVIVNNKPLHEGDSLVSGLRLEEITTEGMIFSYQGYHFRTGVR